ncbi:hypothetical protein HanIR_Chr12g0585081 [Helianthus annuus]|uniref:uncharacterized protein LOC110894885 isoform X2 n=1 Tax=Helianthus annuus TaxID=4232 RepID=UPI000B902CD4|nr:uncharacterized protein LOC110894885 isoform X2 [Helianthus annuus]KAJ0493340.1 hypothetical protein HanIR_Chr12g0585081 [Helianthus annuus]
MSGDFSSDHRHHHFMDKENLFNLPHNRYDEDTTGLTRRFSRSVSLQEPLSNFKISPETTFGWSGHSPAPSDEDAWNLIYAAAGQVARMKMRMNISDGDTGFVAKHNDRGVIGDSWRRSDREELFRQQHFRRNICVAAWGPPQVQNQRYEQNYLKRVGGGGGAVAKRECAGTGVFLPRGYACPIVNSPARMIESSTAPPQIQSSNYEMLMTRRKAMILGAQQQPRRLSNSHGGVMDNPEVLLPQEWTY